MKFILIIIFIIITQFSFSQSAKSNTIGDFGRYGDCSTGRGICGIGADNVDAKLSNAKFFFELKNDSVLLMKIFKSNLSVKDEISIFGKPSNKFLQNENKYFLMEVDLPLVLNVKSFLHCKSIYTKLPKGIYPIVEYQNYYLVEIKLN